MMGRNKKIRLATVFSGIGAIEQALMKKKIDYKIVFACDNGEREISKSYEEIIEFCKNNHYNHQQVNDYVKQLYNDTKKVNRMKESYFVNYKIDEESWFEDIRFIDGKKFENKIDLFVGGSPCQSFSMMGKRAGLEDARGTLFYEYARLVNEIKPKVFIYENVPGMINHDNGNTWKVVREIFESLGYKFYFQILNSKDYGIPQNRQRLFVVGFKNNSIEFNFPKPIQLKKTMFDFLEEKVDFKHYLSKKGFEFVTSHPGRAKVNEEIIRTQKANQQFNWNGDFVFEELDKKKHTKEILSRAFVGDFDGKKGVIRQLSHRECYRLMGFSDTYKIVVPNVWAYRQAGNSIVVDVLENIVEEIMRIEFNGK